MSRSPELQKRINAALEACNDIFAKEICGGKRSRKSPHIARVKAMPDSPKLRAVNAYRKAHPDCSLREAATAAGFFDKDKSQ